MTDVAGVLAYLLLPLAGIAVWRLESVRALALDGRLAIAGAAGAVFMTLVMAVMSSIGLEWSRTRLTIVLLLAIAAGAWKARLRLAPVSLPRSAAIFAIAVLLAITAYGLLTARETIGDLLFFWGPKGVHFARAGAIDVDYLRDPHHFMQHRDYPPLLPLLYAWSIEIAGGFSWWGAVLSSGLCLAAIVAIVRACARDDLAALLTVSVLAWAFASGRVAGGADPVLLLFAAMAVAALLFLRDRRSQTIIAAIGVAGAAVVKVEGASFVVAIAVAMLVDRRPLRQIVAVVLPGLALLGSWIAFLIHAQLLDTYLGPGAFSLRYLREALGSTVRHASYNAFWIPWIAPLIVIALGNVRRVRLPLSVAALLFGAMLYVYLKSPTDPSVFWIPSSAQRVLLTPLLMLLLAAAAAHFSPPERGEGAESG